MSSINITENVKVETHVDYLKDKGMFMISIFFPIGSAIINYLTPEEFARLVCDEEERISK
jgi:hypothetical protein